MEVGPGWEERRRECPRWGLGHKVLEETVGWTECRSPTPRQYQKPFFVRHPGGSKEGETDTGDVRVVRTE